MAVTFFEGEGGGGGGGGWVGINPVSVGTGRTKTVLGISGAAVCKVVLRGVSASQATGFRLRLGNGDGEKASGYKSESTGGNLGSETDSSLGFDFTASGGAAADTLDGVLTLTRAGGNKWVLEGVLSGTGSMIAAAGEVDLGTKPLDRVSISILSTNDTVVFDAGEISVRYSGDSLTVPSGGIVSYTLPAANGSTLGGIRSGGALALTQGSATVNAGALPLNTISGTGVARGRIVAKGSGSDFTTSAITDLVSVSGGGVTSSTDAAGKVTFTLEDPGASVTQSETAPASPEAGDLWFRTTDGVLFTYLRQRVDRDQRRGRGRLRGHRHHRLAHQRPVRGGLRHGGRYPGQGDRHGLHPGHHLRRLQRDRDQCGDRDDHDRRDGRGVRGLDARLAHGC